MQCVPGMVGTDATKGAVAAGKDANTLEVVVYTTGG